MLWISAFIGLLSLLAGLWFRAPAMLFATAGIVLAIVGASVFSDQSLSDVVGWLLASVTASQAAYLAGLALSVWWQRRRSPSSELGREN